MASLSTQASATFVIARESADYNLSSPLEGSFLLPQEPNFAKTCDE